MRALFIITMDKEKRITKLIKEIKQKQMTVSVKTVVVSSILTKGPTIDISDKELIQSIINKTIQS